MVYKGSKNCSKKIWEGRTTGFLLKRFIPPYTLDYQLVTHKKQLTEYRQPLLECAKPLHKLVTY